MNSLYETIVDRYEPNEPIFTDELLGKTDLKPGTFRQSIKRLSDKGILEKVADGIYFLPSKKSVLKKPVLSVDKIVGKKFLRNENEVIGYKSGINFANSLGLTSQTASVPTIVTNNTASNKREVSYYNKKVIIRKPKTHVNVHNYKILQVLDLLRDYERISEEPLEKAKGKIVDYLRDVQVNEEEFKRYLETYPLNTKVKVYELGLINEITRRKRGF